MPKEFPANGGADVEKLRKRAQGLQSALVWTEAKKAADLLPGHGDDQLLGIQSLLCTPLFGIAHRGSRERHVVRPLRTQGDNGLIYEGPELRQDDGLVFMSLLNVAQDYVPGQLVAFDPQMFCEAVVGTYGGSARSRLRQTIGRLQKGLLVAPEFQVQLVGRFNCPNKGDWSVSLDSDVLQLFAGAQDVWLGRELRTRLPSGLATWLYGYIRSQTRLIPLPIEYIQKLCGSVASPKNFRDTLRDALEALTDAEVVKAEWRLSRQGRVHWLKGPYGYWPPRLEV